MKTLMTMFLKPGFTSKSLVLTLISTLGLYASVTNAQTINTNQTGTGSDGYFYSFWNDYTQGSASMTLGSNGNYSTSWFNIGNFTAGKGWSTGGRKAVNFSGSFDGGSNGYLAVYGWTENPLIEYYIVENYGSWTPPGGNVIGSFDSDGGTYNIYKMHRSNAPNVTGVNQDFDQYWSVRTSRRSSGTVNTGNHFDKWSSLGMNMGSKWDYMIVETEGYHSNGSSNVTVSSSGSSSSSSSSSSNGVGTRIEAENYTWMSGIKTEATTDAGGGLDVGWIDSGDWMTYPVNIPTAGSYTVSYRVASLNGGGILRLENAGGNPSYGEINIPYTGGWQNWTTVTQVVNLPAGQQNVGIVSRVGGWNLNWFQIDSNGGGSGTITVHARGTTGQEQIQLIVNNAVLGTWTLSTSYQDYTVNSSATTNILVQFINDNGPRDVQVDYIIAGGVVKQAEDQSYNTGVWQNGACGGGNGHSEWLHCNGAIGF